MRRKITGGEGYEEAGGIHKDLSLAGLRATEHAHPRDTVSTLIAARGAL